MQMLTMCSTAANQRRLYDKTAIVRLEDCTKWINSEKQAVRKALVQAARNTRLGNAPVRSVLSHLINAHTLCTACVLCVKNAGFASAFHTM